MIIWNDMLDFVRNSAIYQKLNKFKILCFIQQQYGYFPYQGSNVRKEERAKKADSVAIISLVITSIGAIGTFPVYKGWIHNYLKWKSGRKLEKLKCELTFFESLKSSNYELMRWFGSSLLILFAMVGVAIMFQGVAVDTGGVKLASLIQSIIGMLAYLFAIFRLGQYRRLYRYEKTVGLLRKQIEMVEKNS